MCGLRWRAPAAVRQVHLYSVAAMNPGPTEPDVTPTISPVTLQLLRCPKTGQPLRLIERDGAEMLSTPDGQCVYEILDGIPVLIASDQRD